MFSIKLNESTFTCTIWLRPEIPLLFSFLLMGSRPLDAREHAFQYDTSAVDSLFWLFGYCYHVPSFKFPLLHQ